VVALKCTVSHGSTN